MAGLQYYDINIAPQSTRLLGAPGTYFRYHTGSAGGADESIVVKGDTGALACVLHPGQSIKLPDEVREWRIENYKGDGTITGIVVVGDGEIQDSQVAGTVQVINGELQRVKAGVAFMGYAGGAGVAGQYTHAQIWNPVANTKNIILSKISILTGSASAIGLNTFAASLGTLMSSSSSSKKLGGSAMSAELRWATNAAIQGAQIGNVATTGTDSKEFQFSEPILLPPGTGFGAFTSTLAVNAYCSFQWTEEPI